MPPKVFYLFLPIQSAAAFCFGPFQGSGSGFDSILFAAGTLCPIGATFIWLYDKPIGVKLTVIPVMVLITMINSWIWIGLGILCRGAS